MRTVWSINENPEMNNSFVVDTNILPYFFDGNNAAGKFIYSVEISIYSISHIELLSNKNITAQKNELIIEFLAGSTILQTTPAICNITAKLRLNYIIKIPDAVIAATVKYLNLPLITVDNQFLKLKN